ncbi:cation transporter [bacterium]|nr:cation transporter [bacterium]
MTDHFQNKNDVKEIRRITWLGIIINLALAGIKFFTGIWGCSQAVIADGVHSISDIATDLAVLFGVKIWAAPPDENHPYGHRRIEAVITVAIGLATGAIALGILYNSIHSFRQPHIHITTWVALIGPIISILMKELLYRWTLRVGQRSGSTAVVANAWHHRSDAFSSLPALLAVVVSILNPRWVFVDHIGALIIALFIIKVAWNIIKPALSELTDSGASQRDCQQIKEIVMGIKGVKDTHAIRTRKFGPGIYVDLHILVEPEISVKAGHQVSENVKQALLQKGPHILDVVVHLEPYDKDNILDS